MCHFFFIVIISPKCPTAVWLLSAYGADERGTHPLDKAVSHTDPSENTLSRGLVWDTLAKSEIGLKSSPISLCSYVPHRDHPAPCPGCRTVLRSGRRAGGG